MSTGDSLPTTQIQRLKAQAACGVARWKEFWFAAEDPFTLGIIRMLTGTMLAYNLLVWGLDLQAFFASDGLQPLAVIREFYGSDPVFSFLFYVPDDWLTVVHWTCFGIAVLMSAGVCSRLTTILCYLITISYSHRVPVANFGLDQILGLLCLYLAIGPSGAAVSVDSMWRRRSGPEETRTSIVPLASCRMTLRLIQIHLCVIYFWAGFAKLKGESWWTGEAMWQVMANQEYQTTDLTWLAWIPWAPYLIAHVTVAWEVFFCVLIWNKTLRPFMLAIGTGMHFGIGAFLGMWTFGLVMTYAYFAFSSPFAWRQRFHWIAPRLFADPTALPAAATSGHVNERQAVIDDLDTFEFEDSGIRKTTEQEVVSELRDEDSPAIAPIANEQLQSVSSLDLPGLGLLDKTASNTTTCPESTASFDDTAFLLIVAADPNERAILRRYFRRHDIPCKAAPNPETAFSMIAESKPVAIVLSGSRFRATQLGTLVEDLADAADVPILAIASARQQQVIPNEAGYPATLLLPPTSPREIRAALNRLMFESSEPEDKADPTAQQHLQHNLGE